MNRQELQRIFEQFQHMRVLVIGDVMTDSYVFGRVDRISPEAPVPVVTVNRRESRPGGAANVAINVKALGASAVLAGVIGFDQAGDEFLELVKQEGIGVEGIIRANRPTTVKTRIIGNQHQLIRMDEESDAPLETDTANKLKQNLLKLIRDVKFDAVIFEDYDKGMLDSELISSIVSLCKELAIPVSADPKKRNFLHYQNVDLFKPNLKELREGLKTDVDPSSRNSLLEADRLLRSKLNHRLSLITLSEYGLIITAEDESCQIPAEEIQIADVSGAGDTVISAATLCLAAGADLKSIAQISNLAGASVCERVGVVPVDVTYLFDSALIALTEPQNNE